MGDASKIILIPGDPPNTPTMGVALYPKSDNKYYSKGPDGVEFSLTGTSGTS
jgi:hypothetical protein